MSELLLVLAALLGLFAGAALITWKKGRRKAFWLGFLVGGLWFVTAVRLARPSSSWAERFYSAEKMERARRRFEQAASLEPVHGQRA